MSTIPPRMRRLAAELKMMQELKQESSLIDFQAEPSDYPNRYSVQFNCLGLAEKPEIGGPLPQNWRKLTYRWLRDQHKVSILLPADYPDRPPQVVLDLPVYHPNITSVNEHPQRMAALAQQMGGQEVLMQVLEHKPELREEVARSALLHVCLDSIIPPNQGGNYHRGIHLRDICVQLGQIIMFQRYNLEHGLNRGTPDSALEWTRWAEKQDNLLPIDPREFLDQSPVTVSLMELNDEVAEIIVEENS